MRRTSAPVVPRAATRLQRFGASCLHAWILAQAASCRFRVADPLGAVPLAHREPCLFAIWHNRLAFSLVIHRRYFKSGPGGRGLAALVSASRDGAFLAAVLERFGVTPVRGSSSRRGAQALVEMKSWADQGLHLAITPDGPRGPGYRVQPGILGLAKATGRPVLPVALNAKWRWNAASWDRFQIPLPLARCDLVFGEPLRVGSDCEEAAMESARLELESRLTSITRD
ncbi:MAG: lysophospholipid acyltransferase family protein [Limisphaerales bacterium]